MIKLKDLIGIFALSLLIFTSCSDSDSDSKSSNINKGDDPNFKIVANSDEGLKSFNRKVNVFGIDIYAVPNVEDKKLLHAANIMAQYLDNDEDDKIDNPDVLNKMIENKAFVVMWASENDLESMNQPAGRMGQDLGNDETHPNFVSGGLKGEFDASIEEIWHIITHAGYSQLYPSIFGEYAGTEISNAMDKARGGNFETIPEKYPSDAWYSYNDNTCEYDCQTTEYFYWAMSSFLGAQANRLNEIQDEWKLNTKEKLETTDKDIYKLLTDPKYNLPKVLPDGTYKH
ncbi:MAG: hypothetical protein N4A49_11480 [Marinifilaceae bacterium]|jgi:hypothetical protein|nr:hypothetical protein [Marinifilaceae bacterium]